MTILYHLKFHWCPSWAPSYDPQKINLKMHLEHLGDSSVRGGRRQWRVFVAKTRVSLGFTYLFRTNGTDDSMPTSVVSKFYKELILYRLWEFHKELMNDELSPTFWKFHMLSFSKGGEFGFWIRCHKFKFNKIILDYKSFITFSLYENKKRCVKCWKWQQQNKKIINEINFYFFFFFFKYYISSIEWLWFKC